MRLEHLKVKDIIPQKDNVVKALDPFRKLSKELSHVEEFNRIRTEAQAIASCAETPQEQKEVYKEALAWLAHHSKQDKMFRGMDKFIKRKFKYDLAAAGLYEINSRVAKAGEGMQKFSGDWLKALLEGKVGV